jgi:hypothetical protein
VDVFTEKVELALWVVRLYQRHVALADAMIKRRARNTQALPPSAVLLPSTLGVTYKRALGIVCNSLFVPSSAMVDVPSPTARQ